MGSIPYDDLLLTTPPPQVRAHDQARPLKVIYIGAGVSGILAAITFLKAVPSLELVIYEKNPEVGGTWFENKYPGCACDIPSHAYQLSFESSTDWTQFYSGAPEILDYWKRVADKYRVRDHVRFNHKCLEAAWDDSSSKWRITLQRVDDHCLVEDEADVFITGTGLLNEWKWPNIEGLHEFKGELLHTARWNESFIAKDKTVAVVGAGSSGIQVVPALASQVKRMDHYVRGKTWICSQFAEQLLHERGIDATNFDYSETEREQWRRNPEAYLAYRRSLEYNLLGGYRNTLFGSDENVNTRIKYEKNMRNRLQTRPEIIQQLIPDFPPLCKRITPGPGYLEALTAPNVEVISNPIVRVDTEGVITADGTKRKVDAIICATGFETRPGYGFPIYGQDGINLRQKYAKRAESYLSVCTDGFPNFFQSLGPNAFIGSGSLLIIMEQVHKYMAQVLRKMACENVKTVQPKRRHVENFTNYCDEYFKKTVYTQNCSSWYKTFNPDEVDEQLQTRVTALWPGSCLHAVRCLESVRWEDYDMEYCDGDDFGWFGNGTTTTERTFIKDEKGLTWYLDGTQFLHEPRILDKAQNVLHVKV